MADVLNVGSGKEWPEAFDVMQEVAKAALLFCLLWYAGQVVARQLNVPLRPASDVYCGLAEPRDPRSVSSIEGKA